MSEESHERKPDEPQLEGGTEDTPDTSTDDEIERLGLESPPPPSSPTPGSRSGSSQEDQEGEPEPQMVVVLPARVEKAHFRILFGCAAIVVGCLTVWEREHLFGKDIIGYHTLWGAALLALALHTLLVNLFAMLQGRTRAYLASFLAGVLGLYVGIKGVLRATAFELTNDEGEVIRKFKSWGDIEGATIGERLGEFLGQIGPGVWLTLIGGLVIVMVFLAPFLPGKGGSERTPSTRGASRRRR